MKRDKGLSRNSELDKKRSDEGEKKMISDSELKRKDFSRRRWPARKPSRKRQRPSVSEFKLSEWPSRNNEGSLRRCAWRRRRECDKRWRTWSVNARKMRGA